MYHGGLSGNEMIDKAGILIGREDVDVLVNDNVS